MDFEWEVNNFVMLSRALFAIVKENEIREEMLALLLKFKGFVSIMKQAQSKELVGFV